ncbi:MAG: hypothetical protein RSC93_06555 [Erysipelotrichaceae bacterium]
MTEKTEKKINDINVTTRLEGMPLTVDDKDITKMPRRGIII